MSILVSDTGVLATSVGHVSPGPFDDIASSVRSIDAKIASHERMLVKTQRTLAALRTRRAEVLAVWTASAEDSDG